MSTSIARVAKYVQELFHEYTGPALPYHNLAHTESVVRHATEICAHYGLPERQRCIVELAAWFHDVGHLISGRQNHEAVSVKVMRIYLGLVEYDVQDIETIGRCILSTSWPTNPVSLEEMILCDADTYHLGTPDFLLSDPAVRQEYSLQQGVSDKDWDQRTLDFLEQHHYFTKYCFQLLHPGKEANRQALLQRIANESTRTDES